VQQAQTERFFRISVEGRCDAPRDRCGTHHVLPDVVHHPGISAPWPAEQRRDSVPHQHVPCDIHAKALEGVAHREHGTSAAVDTGIRLRQQRLCQRRILLEHHREFGDRRLGTLCQRQRALRRGGQLTNHCRGFGGNVLEQPA
jgi:hypothetical protein